jgi:hypothetical protein
MAVRRPTRAAMRVQRQREFFAERLDAALTPQAKVYVLADWMKAAITDLPESEQEALAMDLVARVTESIEQGGARDGRAG